jgi:predicted PurR-regulated permease PerM
MDQPPPQGIPALSARQVIFATLFIVAVGLAFWLLVRFSREVFILFVAIVLGTAIRPGVEWLNRRGISRPTGVVVIYLLLLTLVVGLVLLAAPIVIEQATAISYDLPQYYTDFRGEILQSRSRIMQRLAIQLPVDIRFFPQVNTPAPDTEQGATFDQVGEFLKYSGLFLKGFLVLIAVFLLGFYWTQESDRTIRNISLWFPMNRRDDFRELIDQIESKVGGFILGQSFLCLVIGVMALIAYLLIGLPYALVLAILAGLLEAVPVFGPILGAIPALLVALSMDPSKILWVVIATVVIQFAENYLLVPRVMSRSVGVSPIVTLLALAAFTSLLGLPGALLAVPMAAIIQIFLDRFVLTPVQGEEQKLTGRDQLSVFRYEAQDLTEDMRKQFREKSDHGETMDEIEDAIAAIATDLDRILAKATTEGN